MDTRLLSLALAHADTDMRKVQSVTPSSAGSTHEGESGDVTSESEHCGEDLQDIHPSIGSALHAEGSCKRCCFFPKGRCDTGYACEFCHYDHGVRRRTKRKQKKAVIAECTAEKACVEQMGQSPPTLCTRIFRAGEVVSLNDDGCAVPVDYCWENDALVPGQIGEVIIGGDYPVIRGPTGITDHYWHGHLSMASIAECTAEQACVQQMKEHPPTLCTNIFRAGELVSLNADGCTVPADYCWENDALVPGQTGEVFIGGVFPVIRGPTGRIDQYWHGHLTTAFANVVPQPFIPFRPPPGLEIFANVNCRFAHFVGPR